MAKGSQTEMERQVRSSREGKVQRFFSEVHTDMAMSGTVGTKRAVKGREMMWQQMVVCPTFHSDLPLLGWCLGGRVDGRVSNE